MKAERLCNLRKAARLLKCEIWKALEGPKTVLGFNSFSLSNQFRTLRCRRLAWIRNLSGDQQSEPSHAEVVGIAGEGVIAPIKFKVPANPTIQKDNVFDPAQSKPTRTSRTSTTFPFHR